MKKPYTNTTEKIQHVGCVTIMPGQTREVEESHVQAHFGKVTTKAVSAPPSENPHVLFLSANVKTIKANIADLSAEELDAIEKLEKTAKNPRIGVLGSIAEARLTLAAAPSEIEQFIQSLDGMSDVELTEYVELYKDDEENLAYFDAVNTEIEKRAESNN